MKKVAFFIEDYINKQYLCGLIVYIGAWRPYIACTCKRVRNGTGLRLHTKSENEK